ncbi:MAG: DNA polymerase III subunit delta [Bacteroidales bacterium]|nr:DNA polymerase III subunit delta [Bacteroidales bacterium]
MAKAANDTTTLVGQLESQIKSGDIGQFYLLFGKEHFFIDHICDLLAEYALPPHEREFGTQVVYGNEVSAEQVISLARQFPMMVSRQLVIVKEAQGMKKVDDLLPYLGRMMPTTTLVVCFKTPVDGLGTKNIDKRGKFYKTAVEKGIVLESNPVAEWNLTGWISNYIASLGLAAERGVAELLAESCGTNLSRIALEISKIRNSFAPGDTPRLTLTAIEENVGISREYNSFELSNALSAKNSEKVYRIANHFGLNPKKYPIPQITAVLANHFIRLLKYHAVKAKSPANVAAAMGVAPFALREIENGARNYNVKQCMSAIAIIREFDWRSKSNARGNSSDAELLIELVSRLLSC